MDNFLYFMETIYTQEVGPSIKYKLLTMNYALRHPLAGENLTPVYEDSTSMANITTAVMNLGGSLDTIKSGDIVNNGEEVN